MEGALRGNSPCNMLGARFIPLLMDQSHVLLGNTRVRDSRQHWVGISWSSSSWCDQQGSTTHIISNAYQSVPGAKPHVETL